MREQYKERFPAWCDFVEEEYDLVLSNDVDSLLSCLWLNKMFGWRINYFYDFTALYQIRKSKNDKIYVDIDVVNGKAWGNHVTLISKNSTFNKKMANLNSIFRINRENYCKKFAGSTLLTILSYYGYPAFLLSDETQLVLLAVDTTFKGFYNPDFHRYNYFYVHNVLDFDYLFELQKQYTIDDFYSIIKEYNLHEKISIQNNKLHTKIKLAEICKLFDFDKDVVDNLFNAEFHKIQEFEDVCIDLSTNPHIDLSNAFSFALVNKNFAKLSLVKEG